MDTITYGDIMTIAVFSHVRCYGVLSEREATRRDIISDMADRKPWSTKRKMKERSAKLVAAKGARASTDNSRAAITPSPQESDIVSTSSTAARESPGLRRPQRGCLCRRRYRSE